MYAAAIAIYLSAQSYVFPGHKQAKNVLNHKLSGTETVYRRSRKKTDKKT